MKRFFKNLRRAFFGPSLEDIRDFIEKFPGRCPICSFHYYGVTHGLTNEALPKDHLCLEKINDTRRHRAQTG